jgi:hypothetical protein
MARVVDPTASNAFEFKERSKLGDICVVLLDELEIEPCFRFSRASTLSVKVSAGVGPAAFFAGGDISVR